MREAELVQQPDTRDEAVRICVVGDIMVGSSAICVGWGLADRWPGIRVGDAIAPAQELLRGADIVIGNLEAPLTSTGEGASVWHRDQMRGSADVAVALRQSGFDVLAVANNHAVQHGVRGFDDTVTAIRNAGMQVAGLRGSDSWSTQPVMVNVRSIRIGILAYCWRPRQYRYTTPPFAEGTVEDAVVDIKRLSGQCDVIVVSLHWGDEFVVVPSSQQVEVARQLVEAGAHVIAGHHPHVVRPVEQIGRGVIVHSLGNFISDMVWYPDARIGGVLHCEVSAAGVRSFQMHTVETRDDYSIAPSNARFPILQGSGLPQAEYEATEARNLNRQRLLAYRHAVRNIWRYAPNVLGELVFRTVRNKLSALAAKTRRVRAA